MIPPHLWRSYHQHLGQNPVIPILKPSYTSNGYTFELDETTLNIKSEITGSMKAVIAYEDLKTVRLNQYSGGSKHRRYHYYTCALNEAVTIRSKDIRNSFFHNNEDDSYKMFMFILHKKFIAFPTPDRAYNTGLEQEDFKILLIVAAVFSVIITVVGAIAFNTVLIPLFLSFVAVAKVFINAPDSYSPYQLPYSFS